MARTLVIFKNTFYNTMKPKLAGITANNRDKLKRIIFGSRFGEITDLGVNPDKYLYVLTNRGEIWKIVPKIVTN